MKVDSFANRLKQAMNLKNMKQIELANKTNIDKSLINKYLKGVAEAGNDNLPILAKTLNVNEIWLMGYDVPIEREWTGVIHDDENERFIFKFKDEDNENENKPIDELGILFNKAKPHLSEDDEAMIKFIMNKTIDNYEKSKNQE